MNTRKIEIAQEIRSELSQLKLELQAELVRILAYWATYAPDEINGGFYGKMDNNNVVTPGAPKGSVLNARILWTFSAAYNYRPDPAVKALADRAYDYILNHFIDPIQGGVYWSVDEKGRPLDTRKQVYAIAFTLYALSEYQLTSGSGGVMQQALKLFNVLIENAFDSKGTGYFEAFTKDWKPIADLRLSDKDENEQKTMNTHLHVLEAYTALYRIWPDKRSREQISMLLSNFSDHFIDRQTHHLALFFDENWQRKSNLVSYGHDIEATWLLQQAAAVIGDVEKLDQLKEVSIGIADATLQGLDTDGGLWYEYEPGENKLIREKHWWVQAESMVGFFNAWQTTGDEKYLKIVLANWEFVKRKILDRDKGEWFWGIDKDGDVMPGQDKAGLWKCPYHNGRACLELIKRIG